MNAVGLTRYVAERTSFTLSSILLMAGAFALGAVLSLAVELWWISPAMTPLVIRSIEVTKDASGVDQITVHGSGKPVDGCLRLIQHTLYRDAESKLEDERTYVPLAVAFNGLAFRSVPNFKALLHVPPGTPPGIWNYLSREVYICSVFPGLSRVTPAQSVPREIELK